MARQQAAVLEIGQLGLRGFDTDRIMTEALRHLALVLPVPLTAVLQLDETRSSFTIAAANIDGRHVPPSFLEDVSVPGGSSSLPGFTVLSRRLVRSDDLANDDRFELVAPSYGTPAGAALVAPVGWGEKPWGVLGVWSEEARTWSDDAAHFVQSMANTIGLVIQRRLAEDERQGAVARLELALQAGGLGIFDWSGRKEEVVVDQEAAAIAGRNQTSTVFSETDLLDLVHPEDLDLLRDRIRKAVDTDGHLHTRIRVRNDELVEFRWCEVWGQVIDRGLRALSGVEPTEIGTDADSDDGVRVIGVVDDITDRIRAEARLESLLIAEQSARRSAERARERALMLADASQRFDASLDSDGIFESLADFIVPDFADGCVTLLGSIETLTGSTVFRLVDPDLEPLILELFRRRARFGWTTGYFGAPEAVHRDHGVLVAQIDDEDHRRIAVDEEHLEQLRRLDVVSLLFVPLRARDETVGAVIFVQTGASGRHFDEDDHLLAEQLASRAALARDTALLHESRNRALRSLQSALLPPALPRIDGLELSARYEVAVDDIDVGGDFYDVLESETDGHGLVVGDVVGRGPDAAAITGLVRHSIRTAAVRDSDPATILDQANTVLLDQIEEAEFCTVALVRIDVDETGRARLTAASAGHPCPIVLRADGRVELLDCQGTLLGVVDHPDLRETTTILEPGDAVVLHTDGVTEARRGEEFFGEQRLLDAIADQRGCDADGIADGILAAVNAFTTQPGDDRALFVARVSPRS